MEDMSRKFMEQSCRKTQKEELIPGFEPHSSHSPLIYVVMSAVAIAFTTLKFNQPGIAFARADMAHL